MEHLLGAVTQELDEQRGVLQNEKRQGEDQPYERIPIFLKVISEGILIIIR